VIPKALTVGIRPATRGWRAGMSWAPTRLTTRPTRTTRRLTMAVRTGPKTARFPPELSCPKMGVKAPMTCFKRPATRAATSGMLS